MQALVTRCSKGLALVLLLLPAAVSAGAQDIPEYQVVSGVSGKVSSVGSDTLANMMTLWGETFKRLYPNVDVQIQAAGSSTAPPALTEGSSNLGPMSRMMKSKEIAAFEKRHGYKPTAVPVAVDALVVFVHKDNPIRGLSIPQVDAIFSSTRKCGSPADIRNWGGAGIDSPRWRRKRIQLYGRNSVSGTYGYFKKTALCKGDYKNSVNEQPGSSSVVQSVSKGLHAIGYSGIGYATSSVRMLPISREGENYVAPSPETAARGEYPLARLLYVYVNKPPGRELPPLEREFIGMILSRQGQDVVAKDGYIRLPAGVLAKARTELQLD
ncbi:MAG: phosphate ABC transporter substrate-binding protein PstS family protein [Gammaproteobacteria bacterium AqS3]|nr:phosphate ABC transporter substrate-binding protein PstS family protein [Gammaproteobacteria bacterium AqS3]